MSKQLNLIYAMKDGVITSIAEVESGLKCGCVCPACGEPLVARKGKKMMHHFAHYAGHNCEYGYESSLHLAAKDILSKAKKMIIPAVYVHFPDSYKADEIVSEEMEIDVDRVELEKRFDDVIPDVVVHSGEKRFFIEIYVTHCIDEVKLKKLQAADISTIEIDLSEVASTISAEELEKILLLHSDKKKWKYNSVANMVLQRFINAADKREITCRGFALHIDNCPIQARTWKGKPYANYYDDCLYCPYAIVTSWQDGILCAGRLRIATVADFAIDENMRIKTSEEKIQANKYNTMASGRCPNCGCLLVERKGKYGTFMGCSGYPHCRFTASCDPETGEIIMKA